MKPTIKKTPSDCYYEASISLSGLTFFGTGDTPEMAEEQLKENLKVLVTKGRLATRILKSWGREGVE